MRCRRSRRRRTEGRGGVDGDVVPLPTGGDSHQDVLHGGRVLLGRPPLLHQHPAGAHLPLDLLVLGDHGADVRAADAGGGAPGPAPEQPPGARNLHHLRCSRSLLS